MNQQTGNIILLVITMSILLMLEIGLGHFICTPGILLSALIMYYQDQRCYRIYKRQIIANLPPMDLPFFSGHSWTLELGRIKQRMCNGNRTRWFRIGKRNRKRMRRMRKRMRARNPKIRMIQGSMKYPLTYKTLKENEKINRNIGKWQL